jgi:heat shock protein HslJ
MPEAACPPDLAAQQQTVWQALKGVTSFSLANGQLALTGQRGKTVLRFAPPGPAALANTRWRLAWLLVAGARTEAPGDAGISLSFDERGSAGGVIGCNSFTGAYQAFGQALSFADLKATSLTCGDDLARLEHAYLDALGDVAAYGASSGRLELRDAAGRALMAFEIAGQ